MNNKAMLLFDVQIFLRAVLNFLVEPLGLEVTWTSLRKVDDEAIKRLQAENEQLRFEIGYLNLERRAHPLCYWLSRHEGGFTLHAGDDSVDFEANDRGLDEAEAIIYHDEQVEAGEITDTVLMTVVSPAEEVQG
jgi:hypothetical protein